MGAGSVTGEVVAVALGIVMPDLYFPEAWTKWGRNRSGGPTASVDRTPAAGSGDAGRLARRGVRRGADVRCLLEAVVEDELDVRLGDRNWRLQGRRDVLVQD